MRETALVMGEGRLADWVCRNLEGRYTIERRGTDAKDVSPKTGLALVLSDQWRPAEFQYAEERLRTAGIPWLGAFVDAEEGVVGPLVRPGAPGCWRCADRRRRGAERGREGYWERQISLLRNGAVLPGGAVNDWGLRQMSAFLVSEAERFWRGQETLTANKVYLMDFLTLSASLHAFLPDPLCPACGGLPDDAPEAAAIRLQPQPKPHPGTYRAKPAEGLDEMLFRDYVGERTGMMNVPLSLTETPFADVLARLPAAWDDDWTAGRSFSYAQSGRTAVLEGLERWCGAVPRGKRTVVFDSFRNLASLAINPASTGLYGSEQYTSDGFPYEPFDERKPIHWVWGYSFRRERPVLIPQQLAYYSAGEGGAFVQEGSNGCALGGSLEEAILHGILEAVERDAFLIAWYAKLPLPRLDPQASRDVELRLMADRLSARTGFEALLFDATMEHGIPAVLAVAVNRSGSGPRLLCSAGAHLDPWRAAKSAIFEVAGHVGYLAIRVEENRDDYARMLEDPSLVIDMPDHSGLYALPEAEERLSFWLDGSRQVRDFDEAFPKREPQPDLSEDVRGLIGALSKHGLDVLAVDQTSPEISRNGLHCVKILVPGLLPMTFGHRLRRLEGLDRVLRVPALLGYYSRPLRPEELNPFPHPFL